MQTKEKTYNATKFAPEVIREARDTFFRRLGWWKRPLYTIERSITVGPETSSFASDEEFFSVYRGQIDAAGLQIYPSIVVEGNSSFPSLSLEYTSRGFYVSITMEKAEQVASVYGIFEEGQEAARLPQPLQAKETAPISNQAPQPPAPQLRWPKIFLCYRREDTQWAARSIYETLSAKYGHERVFRDIDSTPAGVKYSTWIESRVGQCNVMVVLIGDGWSSARDDTGQRRLDLPQDWVRQEIEAALKRNIPIIPVRVQGARMPSDDELPSSIADLTGFQSAEVTDSRWTYDVGLLIQSIDDLIESGEKK
jgi:hypothetical protein